MLSSLLKYAAENKLIAEPTLRLHLERGGRKEAPILAVPSEDVQRLVKAATDERYRVAVLLAAEAGLRIGEILGLRWGDIQGGELRVRRAVDSLGNVGQPKHDRTREVPLSLQLALGRMRRRGLWVVSTLDGGMLSHWAGGGRRARCTNAPAWTCRRARRAKRCRGTRCGIRSARTARGAAFRWGRSRSSWDTRRSRRPFATSR